MARPTAAVHATASASSTTVRLATRDQRAALLAWLDGALRPGRPGRLEAEFPTTLAAEAPGEHWIACAGDALRAHAFARRTEVRAGSRHLAVGMIGHVYTAPEARGSGLASGCVEAAAQSLIASGAALVVLWSDLHDFYARLGFAPAGVEIQYRLSRDVLARAGAAELLEIGTPREHEWPELESLYAALPSRAVRAPGDLAALAAAPEVALRVARRAERVIAYAARGRGDDFADTVHEWAGEADGVVACLADLHPGGRSLQWLCGPIDHEACARVRAAGGQPHLGRFALARVGDPEALWRAWTDDAAFARDLAVSGDARGLWLQHGVERTHLPSTSLLQGALGPRRARLPRSFPRGLAAALRTRAPLPIFVWGFDSV